ncbi:MAG: hypothetical protein U0K19_03490 [Bifidobacteriaceae bacterium]|nr:hypothetical protein [Bifidobacteriaceae bacterium]
MPLDFTAISCAFGGGGICAIGAARVRDGSIVDTYYQLVKPNGTISAYEESRNGHVGNEAVRDAPSFEQVVPDFVAFIGADDLVSYDVPKRMKPALHDELFARHISIPHNMCFDCANLFLGAVDRRLDPGRPKAERSAGLVSAMRVVLGETKRRHAHNACADAALIARITVQILHEMGMEDLLEADRTMLGRNLTAVPACRGRLDDIRVPRYVSERLSLLRMSRFNARDDDGSQYERLAAIYESMENEKPRLSKASEEYLRVGPGAQMRALRDDFGMSVESAARFAHISPDQVRAIEARRTPLSDDTVATEYGRRMCETLDDAYRQAAEMVERIMADADDSPDRVVSLEYYRSQESFDEVHPEAHGMPYELLNFVTRTVQHAVMSQGGPFVVMRYAGE